MRVVLVLPGSGFRNSSPTSLAGGEHLGLGSIAAYLRQFGHDVSILNFQVEENLFYPRPANEVAEKILSYDPDIVGMSITGLTIEQALVVASIIKQKRPSLHVCWGSHQAASCAADILQHETCVDTIVAGDGEIPMQKLLEALEHGKPLATVPGLWYRDYSPANNSPAAFRVMQIKLTSQPPEPDINTLPFPARDTLEELIERNVNITDARIYTSRGCPFKCTFCVYPELGYLKKWRDRSSAQIVEEIKYLTERYGITHFWFSDDNFTLPTARSRFRALDLAEILIKENLGITYRVLMRADAVDGHPELLEALARSGLTCVYMGIESGSPRRLEYLEKHANPDVYSRAIKLVRDHGIGLQIGFIMFDPMTSWADLEIDANFLRENEEMYLYTNYAQVLYAYPGTPVAKTLVEKGLLPKDFNYRSGYREYAFEDPKVGRLAEIALKSNSKGQVEVDDFFRRLRMIDVPGLYRSGAGRVADEVNLEVETRILDLNNRAYDLFMKLLELGRAGTDYERMSSLIESHYQHSFRSMMDLASLLRMFPDKAVRQLSALKLKGQAKIGSEAMRAGVNSPLRGVTAAVEVTGDCA